MSASRRKLNRADVGVINEKLLSYFISSPPAVAREYALKITSGTSGTPLISIVYCGPSQWDKFRESGRIVSSFGSLNRRLSEALRISNDLTPGPKKVLLVDANDMSPGLSSLLEDFAPDTVAGVASFVARLCPYFGRTGAGVRILRLSGEYLVPGVQSLLRSTFTHARRLMHYSTSEFGGIGRQCKDLPPNHYHPLPSVTIEIAHPDETGRGDIIVSKRLENGFLFDRYDIGDAGRLHPGPCACGASVTFEHLGRRGHDYFKLAGAILRREEFDRVAALFKQYIDDYRAYASEVLDGDILKGKIVLRAFTESPTPSPALAEEIAHDFSSRIFLTPSRTLADLVATGVFLPLEVEFSRTPFPQKHKDIKLVRIELNQS